MIDVVQPYDTDQQAEEARRRLAAFDRLKLEQVAVFLDGAETSAFQDAAASLMSNLPNGATRGGLGRIVSELALLRQAASLEAHVYAGAFTSGNEIAVAGPSASLPPES
ncbi:hypothetical protein ACFPIF_15220 [Brevundimonas faecalis]|uniref:hypothetical protein n=1 Tax=Brevundimonas faecalis TaxID=947378 RepID=UPI00361E9CA9